MRKTYNLIMILALLLGLGSCYNNEVGIYDGPSQLHFIKTFESVVIDNSNPIVTIEVGVSKAVDTNRTFNVMIVEDESSAIEGVSFELLTSQITIAAGEVLGEVQVQGLYEGAEPNGQILKLQLNSDNANAIAEYKNAFNLELFKFCDFDQQAFIGRYKVYEHAFNGEFEYEVDITAGDDIYSVFVDGLWAVEGSQVQITFERSTTNCNIPAQFFFNDPSAGYDNVWIRSLSPGAYNSCLGTIMGLEYFVYPGDSPNVGWDRGTFDMIKIE